MSGLVGLWNLDGRPVDPALLAAMAATILHRGSDDLGTWSGGGVGLACHLRRITPESAAERQPVTDADGNVLVFDGRLDDRDELLATLDDGARLTLAADSELILAAWRQWGDACLARLKGDFALAVFEAGRHSMVLARDPVGYRPLYYWTDGRCLGFASEIKALMPHPRLTAAPNRDLVADLFLLERLPYEDDGETFFEGVSAVLPGQRIRVTASKVDAARFWDFDPTAQVRYPRHDDYAEHLRELLIRAVRRRMRTDHAVAVSHSGGLDSSVVLSLADELTRRGDGRSALLPMSYSPIEDQNTEENRFIRLLEQERGLCVARLPMGEPGMAAQLTDAAWYSESPVFDTGWCAEEPLLRCARAQGARTLLTGLWSDQILFAQGYLVDLFRRFAWIEIVRHLREYRHWFVDVDAAYFRAALTRELLLNLTPGALRRSVRAFRTSRVRPRHPGLMTSELERRVRRRRPRNVHPRYATAHARNVYQMIRSKAHRMQFEAEDKTAARYGLARVSPFIDRDVVAFLMSIPGEVQTRGGVPRALLRDAMRGLVPEPILRRRWPDEGTVSSVIDRAQREAYMSVGTDFRECRQLGFCREAGRADAASLELIGLEFWSRTFFSGSLQVRQARKDAR